MDHQPSPSLPGRAPLWLLAGGVCCALLLVATVFAAAISIQPESPVEVAQPADLPGQSVGWNNQRWQAEIDAEVDELLSTPAFQSTQPEPSLLDVAFEVATQIDGPIFPSCPGPEHDPNPKDRNFWELPRRAPLRKVTFTQYGSATEQAVEAALAWLAAHQQPDGGWSFNHQQHNKCDGTCTHPGKLAECRTAATSLALLSLLGAGQTHKQGKYKKNVDAGLHLLTQHMKVRAVDGVNFGNLSEGGEQIHAQALSTLVLCEAYAMSQDKHLKVPAQYVVNGLLLDPVEFDDGWRWMALRSANLANLEVMPSEVTRGNQLLPAALLDRNHYQGAAANQRQKLIAVGALASIFAERRLDDPAIQQGIQLIDRWGPKTGNLDYRYFATQTLRQDNGDRWKKWYALMGEKLIAAQEKSGHAKGSWHFADDDAAAAGGRLYCTAMATAILEVYYRHQPIYAPVPPQ